MMQKLLDIMLLLFIPFQAWPAPFCSCERCPGEWLQSELGMWSSVSYVDPGHAEPFRKECLFQRLLEAGIEVQEHSLSSHFLLAIASCRCPAISLRPRCARFELWAVAPGEPALTDSAS